MESYLPTLTIAGVLGFLAPLASSALNRVTFSPRWKQLMAIGVAVIFGCFAMLVTGGVPAPADGQDPLVYAGILLLAVIAVSQIAYSMIWKPSGVADRVALATATKAELAIIEPQIEPGVINEVDELPWRTADREDGPDHRA